MTEPKTILVPTDFSEAAEAALDVALELAAQVRAKVHLMHAIEPPYVGFSDGLEFPTADLVTRIQAKGAADLAASLAKRSGTRVDLASILVEGDPRETVLEAAEEVDADLVIMGTHGRRGLRRALMGSVAESVVRECARPVMTVHGPRAVAGPFQHILVPTDFTDTSRRALDVALELARASGASITLLHIWSLPMMGYGESLMWPREALERAAQEAMNDLLVATKKVHGKTDALLRQGSEATVIIEAVTSARCDLVVLGTHGRLGLARLLLGSVAGEVIRRCAVPVLTVGNPSATDGVRRALRQA